MTLGLTVAGVSALVLFSLTLLFRAEEANGSRLFLSTVRSFCDRVIVWFAKRWNAIFVYFGAGVFRATFHYCLHRVLSFIIAGLTRVQKHLYLLHQRHKRQAKVSRTSEQDTHLDAIAAHKEEVSLSDEEIRKRKSY